MKIYMYDKTSSHKHIVRADKDANDYKGKSRMASCFLCHKPIMLNNKSENTKYFNIKGRQVVLCAVCAPVRIDARVYNTLALIKQLPVNKALHLQEGMVDIGKLRSYIKSKKLDIEISTVQGCSFAYFKADADKLRGELC